MNTVSAYIRNHHLGLIAIFIALTGTAWAAGGVGPRDIRKDAVRAKHVKDGKIGTAELANDDTTKALTGQDVAAGSLTGADVAADSVDGTDVDEATLFNDGTLDTADIDEASLYNDGSLNTADVDEASLFNDGSLDTADIDESTLFNDNSLSALDIAVGGVGASEIANNTITSTDIVDTTGGIESHLQGDFRAGIDATAGNPTTATITVQDDTFFVTRDTIGGNASVLAVDADNLSTRLAGDLNVDGGFISLHEDPAPGSASAQSARLYVVDVGGTSSLAVKWPNGTVDLLAQE